MERDRRRSQRLVPAVETTVAVRAGDCGRLLDVSPYGVLIEVGHPLAPSKRCSLTIEDHGDPIVVTAQVRRCRAVLSPANGHLVYHAALEFADGGSEAVEDWIVEMRLEEGSGSAPAVRTVVRVAEPRH